MSTEHVVTVVCMDCQTITKAGPPGAAVSHGLCPKCAAIRFAAMDAEDEADRSAQKPASERVS